MRWEQEKNELLMNVFACLLLSSQLRSSLVSVVFDFSDSLSDVAPVPSMRLPVYVKWKERANCRWLCFLLSSLLRLSFTSVVFDFNDSLNDVAPVSPILLPVVGKKEMAWVNCWWMSFVYLVSSVFTTQIEFNECCVWFQWFTQWRCSFVSNPVPCWCE